MAEKMNKLTGKEWLQYSFSIWKDMKKNKEEWTLKHPAMFPIILIEKLIDIFTNSENQVILDPFMGSGSTLIAAQNKNRKGIGFEINKEYISMAKNRLDNVYRTMDTNNKNYEIINASATDLDKYLSPNSIDLTITSPPYWDILNMKRTADGKKTVNYSNDSTDIGNISNYEYFIGKLKNIFTKVYQVLKYNGYCIVIVMDIRKRDKLYPFHSDIANCMKEIGFSFEDIIIWDRQHEYNNMKPLGYPYIFRVNKVHEYILIFKKLK